MGYIGLNIQGSDLDSEIYIYLGNTVIRDMEKLY